MKRYLYIPFILTEDRSEEVEVAKKYFSQKMNEEDMIWRDDDQVVKLYYGRKVQADQLAVVQSSDVLFILGHGDANDFNRIIAPAGCVVPYGFMSSMTAGDLAQHLKDQKLGQKHKAIRLMVCYSGGSISGPPNSPQVTVNSNCFAALLANSMSKLGYDDIVVGGYPGIVDTPENGLKSVTYQNRFEMLKYTIHTKNRNLFRWYNGQGKNVDRPYDK